MGKERVEHEMGGWNESQNNLRLSWRRDLKGLNWLPLLPFFSLSTLNWRLKVRSEVKVGKTKLKKWREREQNELWICPNILTRIRLSCAPIIYLFLLSILIRVTWFTHRSQTHSHSLGEILVLPSSSCFTLWNKNWQIISFVRVARVNSINGRRERGPNWRRREFSISFFLLLPLSCCLS